MIRFLAILGLGCLVGCFGSGPRYDAARPVDARVTVAEHKADHAPWGSVAVDEIDDRRPSYELGRENYLNDSWFADQFFERSVPASMRLALERELVRSGAFSRVEAEPEPKYLIKIDLRHFTAKVDRDLIGLIPVIPSIDIEAWIDLRLRLVDQDGRPFLDKRYVFRSGSSTATVSGVEAGAQSALLEQFGLFVAEVVKDCDAAIPAFWQRLGRPIQ